MVPTSSQKQNIIKEDQVQESPGSIEGQVLLLSKEIDNLAKHLKTHRKDFSSKLGLIKMLNKRKRFLAYLKKRKEESYKILVKKLNL